MYFILTEILRSTFYRLAYADRKKIAFAKLEKEWDMCKSTAQMPGERHLDDGILDLIFF